MPILPQRGGVRQQHCYTGRTRVVRQQLPRAALQAGVLALPPPWWQLKSSRLPMCRCCSADSRVSCCSRPAVELQRRELQGQGEMIWSATHCGPAAASARSQRNHPHLRQLSNGGDVLVGLASHQLLPKAVTVPHVEVLQRGAAAAQHCHQASCHVWRNDRVGPRRELELEALQRALRRRAPRVQPAQLAF